MKENIEEAAAIPKKSAMSKKSRMEHILDVVERVGNKVPHPAVIFIWLIVALIVVSHILHLIGASATYESINPETHQLEQVTTTAQSLLTADGIRFLYTDVVKNFMSFNAVGVIIDRQNPLELELALVRPKR